MDINHFFETFLGIHDEIECHNGLKLVWTGEYGSWGYTLNKFDVPIFEVHNPNNSPYTESCLSYILEETIETFRRMMPILDDKLANDRLYKLDLQGVYIPMKMLNKIQSCLKKIKIENKEFEVGYKNCLVSGYFTGEYDFELDDNTVIVSPEFVVDSVTLNGEYIEDDGDLNAIRYAMYDYYSDWYDDLTWNCFSELYENNNFVNKDGMGWNTGIQIII